MSNRSRVGTRRRSRRCAVGAAPPWVPGGTTAAGRAPTPDPEAPGRGNSRHAGTRKDLRALTWSSGVHHRGLHGPTSHLEEMTMPSSNPAFSRFGNAGSGQQYAGWGNAPQQYGAPTQHDPYAAPSPYAPSTTRYMTMDDVVTKTGLASLVRVRTGTATGARPGPAAWGLALPAALVAFVLGLVISFKQIATPAATLAYGALYGVALGAISEAFDTIYPGIVIQAVIGTFGVFAG